MPNLNKVMLMGNLTRDIELRYTPSNQPVANLGLAVNRQYQTREGEKREETTFVDCEAWGRTAEVLNQYLQKGRPVYVEGRLKLDTWQDQQSGQNRSKLRVVIENFQFIDSRRGGGGGQGGGAPSYQAAGGQGGGQSGGQGGGAPAGGGGGYDPGHQPVSEDDIPF